MAGLEARIHEFCTTVLCNDKDRYYIQSMISPTEPRSQAVKHLLRTGEISN
jgi:hypothetical protein